MNNGSMGEKLVANFFDSEFSKYFSFPNPLTKLNQEVADVIVWWNRVVFLIEVKTRSKTTNDINIWAKDRIEEATIQITKNNDRIKNNENIYLHNNYFHTTLDCEEVHIVIGLIVLVHDEPINILPSTAFPEIYNQEIPIHVISWNDLIKMTKEINTIPDLKYYLTDRFDYLRISDIALGQEMNVIGNYKINSNKFPREVTDFSSIPFWGIYIETMVKEIMSRDSHNDYSIWIDIIESVFNNKRKLFDGLPIGLYFVWELGSISLRERAYFGEKLDSVQISFMQENSSRLFALLNVATGNWLVFFYSQDEKDIKRKLQRFVELKLLKEVHENNFNGAAYGFGLLMSNDDSPKLLGIVFAVVIGADEVKGNFSQSDIEESYKYFEKDSDRKSIPIEEFPKRKK